MRRPAIPAPAASVAAARCSAKCAEYLDYVLGEGGGHRRGDHRDGALDRCPDSAAGVLPDRARRLRSPRRAADPGRGADLPRAHRPDVRVRALRDRSGHGRARQRARRRGVSDGGSRRAPRSRPRRRGRARPLHAREELGRLRRGARDARRDRRRATARALAGLGARALARLQRDPAPTPARRRRPRHRAPARHRARPRTVGRPGGRQSR